MCNPVLSRSTTSLRERVFNNNGIKPGFLQQQNTFLKLLISLSGVGIALISRWEYFLAVWGITIIWLVVDINVIRQYLKILLSISPFLASYLVLGLIFRLMLQEQVIFIGRIILLLLFSVFLLKTTDRIRLLKETEQIRKWEFINDLFVFGLATGKFVRLFTVEIQINKKRIRKIDDLVKIIIDSFHNVYLRVGEIEKEVYQAMEKRDTSDFEFYNWANVYLTLLLVLYTVILAL